MQMCIPYSRRESFFNILIYPCNRVAFAITYHDISNDIFLKMFTVFTGVRVNKCVYYNIMNG